MSIIERALPAERAAALLASGLCFALADLALKLLVHAVWGEYGAWDFRAGSLVGFFGAVVVGMAIALPTTFGPSGRVVSLALGIVLLTYHAFAYSTYADTGHLPLVSSLFGYAASADLGFVSKSAGLGAAAALAYGLGVPPLERRLRSRLAPLGMRVADFATIALFALLGLATLFAGSGPVYYGVISPSVHLVAGRLQESPNPLPPEANVHDHGHHHSGHEHEHGFVPPDETVEPFPADGVPRPAESMRLQYQGLLGVEAFLPIEDTAYPYCRSEDAPAALARPHDVVVVNLSGVARSAAADALPFLEDASRDSRELGRFFAVSDDRVAGRRALITGLPPTVGRAFVPDVPELPSAVLSPNYPSLARTLGELGVHTAYFGPDPGLEGTERLELAALGFDLLSYGDEAPATSSADDLATLTRLRSHLEARAGGPRFSFVELGSLAGETPADPRVTTELEALVRGLGGATVIFTSDHVAGGGATAEEADLGVPMIVLGDELPEAAAVDARLGAAYDLPLTVLGRLGATIRRCHQGRDLLGTGEPFPARRVVLAQVGASGAEFVVVEARDGGEELLRWNIVGTDPLAAETPVTLYDLELDEDRKNDLFERRDPDWPQLDEFWKSHLAIGIYLLRTDRFARAPARERDGGSTQVTEPRRVEKVGRAPDRRGRFVVPAHVFDGGAAPADVLGERRRGKEVTLDVRASAFETRAALDTWIGADLRRVDGVLVDGIGMAVAFGERDEPKSGLWMRPAMGQRGGLYSQLAEAGVDFVMMPLATDEAVRKARARGLEVWVPRARLETLESATPDVVVD